MRLYYDDNRESDARALEARTGAPVGIHLDAYQALAVFVLDPTLRPVIEAIDPKAMEQARSALLLD